MVTRLGALRPYMWHASELLWTQWVRDMAYDEGLVERMRTRFQ